MVDKFSATRFPRGASTGDCPGETGQEKTVGSLWVMSKTSTSGRPMTDVTILHDRCPMTHVVLISDL